jgi:predicted nucleic acid-binding Zn ribbon protein
MIKLSTAIKGFLNNPRTNQILLIGTLQNEWEKIVGRLIGQATQPIKIESQKLYIKCKNPTWKTELQYQKLELIKKISKHTKIKDIILI